MTVLPYHPTSELLRRKEMANLPEELKFNIFSRLPVKVLCRCKCVCKEWFRIVNDPYFLNLHLERSKRNRQLLLLDQSVHDDDEYNRPQIARFFGATLDGELLFRAMGIVGGYVFMMPSGHGLVCLVNKGNFYIFNPSIRKTKKLPKPQTSTFGSVDAGFGYIPSTNEYKLVHLYDKNEYDFAYNIKCEILTLSDGGGTSSNPWRVIEKECPYMVRGWGVLAKNRFYWMTWEGCQPTLDELIISLDLETETFEFIPHPHVTSFIEGNDMHLVELQGHLCLVDTFAYPPVTNVWMLKDPVKKKWVKIYTIDLTKLEGFDDELTQITISGYQNGEIIINSQQEGLDYFNVRSKVIRRGPNMNLQWDTGMCLYTETFFSLG